MAKGKGGGSNFRSAISGRFVTAKHAQASPQTTVREAKGGGSTGSTYRSATTGKFVTTKHGKASPRTTIKLNATHGAAQPPSFLRDTASFRCLPDRTPRAINAVKARLLSK